MGHTFQNRCSSYRLFSSKSVMPGIILFILFLAFPVGEVSLFAQTGKQTKVTVTHIITEDYDGIPLSHPSRLLHDSFRRETYVVDSGNGRILIYTHDFFPLMSIGKIDGLEHPLALALDSAGSLFVTQSPSKKYPNGRLSVFNARLKWERDILFEGFEGADTFTPYNIAFHKNGSLYVTGRGYRGVVVLNKDGNFSHILSVVDSFAGETMKAIIFDVEIDEHGTIYLLSAKNGRVYIYDAKENFLLKFGRKGGGPGKMSRPRGLTVDIHKKWIYIVDYMRHTVSAYSLEGKLLFEFGGLGWSKGWLQFPSDISKDREGNVIIADTFNNRIQVFKIVPLK